MKQEKKVLLIDIGGIFFSPEWRKRGISEVSRELGVKKEDFKGALEKNKRFFYLGRMTESEYWQATLNLLRMDINLSTYLVKRYREFVIPTKQAIDLLPTLSRKYTLVSFNNSSREWMDYRITLASLDKYFTYFFTSGYTRYLKPEKKSFTNILKKFSSTTLIYVDDNEDYLREAVNYKIKTLLANNYKDLEKLL